jgi:1-acyl-sn-glycerol-3-phosphate acyltransferase
MSKSLASIWSWFAIALVVVIGFWIQLPLFLVTVLFDRRRAVAGRFFRIMAIAAVKMIPSWKFKPVTPHPNGIEGRTVCVSNHASHADAFLISHLPWEMKWLGKASLFKVPFLGWSMFLAGDIAVHRGHRDSVGEAMRRCAFWLDRGMPVMIFPEGTRSLDGELLPFKDGAFRLAIETQSQLLPLAVSGTYDALAKHSWKFGNAEGRVKVGTPIITTGMTIADVPALKEAARAQIIAMKKDLVTSNRQS